ncbi:GNAT family N-acetyltransferase [Candidatus Poribacteria bacterium]|nr:GNAT family N-acetyltransferase [Candidatus Poribacteria bacterium]
MSDLGVQIITLSSDDGGAIKQVAVLLIEGFKAHAPNAWSNMAAALEEVRESFGADRISRIALDQSGEVVGWIGGLSHYDGNVWEIHPLVVQPSRQGGGIGRQLVRDFEAIVRERGGLTIWVGTDDETSMTTLAGVDLYPNVLGHLARINEFYQKLGFVIAGAMPDANGRGKPDIFLAKRVAPDC